MGKPNDHTDVAMVAKAYFVTGTDTGSGKTWMTLGLLSAFRRRGFSSLGMKPMASGCKRVCDDLVSEDAELIREYSSLTLPYQLVNPIAYEYACSPNLAAQMEKTEASIEPILNAYKAVSEQCDITVLEGIGGWRAPLSENFDVAKLVKSVQAGVILTVAVRLGCINHALLTLEAIDRDNAKLVGWVAVYTEPDFGFSDQTLKYMRERIDLPLLGVVPFLQKLDPVKIGAHLNLDLLQY